MTRGARWANWWMDVSNALCQHGWFKLGMYLGILVQEIGAWFAPPRRRAAANFARGCGYSWLPCSACGEWFGGQEWTPVSGHEITIPDSKDRTHGHGICKACAVAGVGDRAWAAARKETR